MHFWARASPTVNSARSHPGAFATTCALENVIGHPHRHFLGPENPTGNLAPSTLRIWRRLQGIEFAPHDEVVGNRRIVNAQMSRQKGHGHGLPILTTSLRARKCRDCVRSRRDRHDALFMLAAIFASEQR